MAYALTEELDRLVREKMATGNYQTEEEVLRAALRLLDEEQQVVAAVTEGYEDVKAGRHRSFEEADAEFRGAHNFPQEE
ncbi:type II toxin-antitoxin system ParD family antitoxin [Pirellulales bacterium]|nr:type II toxin-antitoxin system ParD family antitoxin [Pirellulales bacterium]